MIVIISSNSTIHERKRQPGTTTPRATDLGKVTDQTVQTLNSISTSEEIPKKMMNYVAITA